MISIFCANGSAFPWTDRSRTLPVMRDGIKITYRDTLINRSLYCIPLRIVYQFKSYWGIGNKTEKFPFFKEITPKYVA
jgi:hypothetical protein